MFSKWKCLCLLLANKLPLSTYDYYVIIFLFYFYLQCVFCGKRYVTLILVDRELLICLSWTKKISRCIQFSLFTDFYILRSPWFWRISISLAVNFWGDALHLIQKDNFSDSKKSKINDTKITKETFFSIFSFTSIIKYSLKQKETNKIFLRREVPFISIFDNRFMWLSLNK